MLHMIKWLKMYSKKYYFIYGIYVSILLASFDLVARNMLTKCEITFVICVNWKTLDFEFKFKRALKWNKYFICNTYL